MLGFFYRFDEVDRNSAQINLVMQRQLMRVDVECGEFSISLVADPTLLSYTAVSKNLCKIKSYLIIHRRDVNLSKRKSESHWIIVLLSENRLF